VLFAGYSDAMTSGGWHKHAGRRVTDEEWPKPFYILKPIKKWARVKDPDNPGETINIQITVGFGSHKVYGLEQTEVYNQGRWEEFSGDSADYLDTLPWLEVAREWNITVKNAHLPGAAGFYTNDGSMIGLGVKNLSTWAHELNHAADDKNATITREPGQQPDNEIVAELGGAILLKMIGMEYEADLGGCWEYICKYSPQPMDAIDMRLKRTKMNVELIISTALSLDDKMEATA